MMAALMRPLNDYCCCGILSPVLERKHRGDDIVNAGVVKQGNIYTLELAKEILQQVGITENMPIQVFPDGGRIIIQKTVPQSINPNTAKIETLLEDVRGNYKIVVNGRLHTKKTVYSQRLAEYGGEMIDSEWDTGPPVGDEVY